MTLFSLVWADIRKASTKEKKKTKTGFLKTYIYSLCKNLNEKEFLGVGMIAYLVNIFSMLPSTSPKPW